MSDDNAPSLTGDDETIKRLQADLDAANRMIKELRRDIEQLDGNERA